MAQNTYTTTSALSRYCRSLAGVFAFAVATLIVCLPINAGAIQLKSDKPTLHRFRHELAKTVRADHPAIQPVVQAIRAITSNPVEQLTIVNDVSHLLVDFDDDARLYGRPDYHATLDEMLAMRRENNWLYLRDDCDGRAIFAAHLLAGLGIDWRLEASYWKRHAWIIARVDGKEYDLLDFQPEGAPTNRLSYRLIGRWVTRQPHHPPLFQWRRAWAERTKFDIETGLHLGLLAVDSSPGRLRERYAKDWTKLAPLGQPTPPDSRLASAVCAGFPFGESLGSALAARIGGSEFLQAAQPASSVAAISSEGPTDETARATESNSSPRNH
jgi:hypothetical protein